MTNTHITNVTVRLSFGKKLERAMMPASYLADKKALAAFLYQNNITGFSIRQTEGVCEYLRGSMMRYNDEHPTDSAYTRLGWSGNDFVLGTDLIMPDGIKPANLIRVQAEMRDDLSKAGSEETWAKVTQELNKPEYWAHRFTVQAILGSPLLKLLGVDSAVLSLAGDSGVSKTTIARFGLSAYGSPKALEIAPQSTEKAFQEKWRIAQNLPVVCNEAATIDVRKINNIVYAAANGEPRDTLTQRVELRTTNRWSLLTVFTSNNHLHGLDDSQLNEAGKRRILELTIENALDGELSRALNDVMRENYGHAGSAFMEYVVENKDEVTARLRAAYEWTHEQGVKSEDRFCAWIVTVAKVAGEIGQELDLLRFNVNEPCQRAIEAVKEQAQTIKAPSQRVEELITDFINAHQGHLTTYTVSGHGAWITSDVRGEVVGRYTTEKGSTTLAVARKVLTMWGRERGIDAQHITRYAQENGIGEKPVKLVPHGKTTRCLIIPVPDEDAPIAQAEGWPDFIK